MHSLKSAHRSLALAFKKARERTRACECAHQRAPTHPRRTPGCQESADVSRLKRAKVGQRRSRAEMLYQKVKELADIAGVRLDRVCRIPALGTQMFAPAHDRIGDLG